MIEGHELGSVGVNPQWLMFGVELVERVWPDEWAQGWRYLVIGSSELQRAELVNEMRFARGSGVYGAARTGRAMEYRTTFKTNLGSYTMAFGATYAEAIRRLFDQWSPDNHNPPPELPAGEPLDVEILSELGRLRVHVVTHPAHQMRSDVAEARDYPELVRWHETDHTVGPSGRCAHDPEDLSWPAT